jgi:two-component system, NarL family, response regulator NreC
MNRLRVLLAEDHKVVREGLRMLLERDAQIEVVGEADDGLAAVTLAQALKPDVLVLDISMPEHDGLEAAKLLRTMTPETKILILTRHSESSYVRELLRAGARGYVLKQGAAEGIVRAVMRVASGEIYLDPIITDQAVATVIARRSGSRGKRNPLSDREANVLRFVALGFLAKEIAKRLGISIKTVQTHKANAMLKLGMHTRIDIVRYAILQGWLQQS